MQSQSDMLFQKALNILPGGVNSPVRAFRAVGGNPLFIKSAHGSYVETQEGRKLLDYVSSYGPLINGHTHDKIISAIEKAARLGTAFGAPTLAEIELAETVIERVPGIEMLRMTNSGTEAVMSVIRLARAATGRDNILKFSGCYHGHCDSLLVSAGSGALTFGVPNSPGIPKSCTDHTLVTEYNDISSLEQIFLTFGNTLAAVIVEPIAGNMGCVMPSKAFHHVLRDLCYTHGVLLIWDEVMTGFRVARGGSVELFGINPDLVTFGKIIGGGMPVGAIGGSSELLNMFAPAGKVYQAGTLSGNPLAMAAGIANLQLTDEEGFYPRLEKLTKKLADGLRDVAKNHGVDVVVNDVCGMLSLFFSNKPMIAKFADVETCDTDYFAKFFHAMLEEGIYLPPSSFETWFISSAHTDEDIERTIAAADKVFANL